MFWGLATNPQGYEKLWGPIRIAKTRSLGLDLPIFRVFFQIENEGKDDERILLCWIEEIDAIDEIMD